VERVHPEHPLSAVQQALHTRIRSVKARPADIRCRFSAPLKNSKHLHAGEQIVRATLFNVLGSVGAGKETQLKVEFTYDGSNQILAA
jgi:hypothetical protein